jgi:V8-like Glu-specific endopeptidase
MCKSLTVLLTVAVLGWAGVGQATAQVRSQGGVTVLTVPNTGPNARAAGVDFVNAKALALPRSFSPPDQIQALMSRPSLGIPGFATGAPGNGARTARFLGTPATVSDDGVGSQEFGTSNHPFSTAMADLVGGVTATNTSYPYRASGKLFFKIGDSTYVCSASLIKRGVVVTAAHCVANYGARQFYGSWQFVPGYRNGAAPYGVWSVAQAWVKTSYYNGTDGCAVYGVVCPNDVAILTLSTQSGGYPGTATGWYGYGWGGFGFAGTLTQVTQIGYPVCLDSGVFMERNDSYGFVSAPNSNNTVIGSLMCGGSSGGPWLVNFGIRPVLSGTASGTASDPNIVVGVTSWGYTSVGVKEQGASPFTAANVPSLVTSACTAVPAACS